MPLSSSNGGFIENMLAADEAHARGDKQALGRALLGGFHGAEDVSALDDLIGWSFGASVDTSVLPPASARFVEGVADLRRNQIAGLDFDFLGERPEIADWRVAQFLNILRLRRTTASRGAAVISAMRDDGIYAIEWIAHYQALGFDTLVVYSNDNADASERLLRRLAEHGQIYFVESVTSGKVRPEVKAFEHAFHFNLEARACEWALFVDSDELFVPAPRFGNRIEPLLAELRSPERNPLPSAVLYNWLWYNSDLTYERKPGLLLDRFRHASPNPLTKCFVKLRDLLSMRLQHTVELFPGAVAVDSAYKTIDAEQVWSTNTPSYAGGRINHYWPKSFQEFSLKKARGEALPLDDDEYRRSFSLFFEWNALDTPETYTPPDSVFLGQVKARCAALRELDGVAEAERLVESRFAHLLGRYRKDGGLDRIYRHLRKITPHGSMPTS